MNLGLLLTAFGLGLRHGVDWDHIAAIADLSGSAENRRRGFVMSMLYAIGHGAVVFGLGMLAIAFGTAIPESLDEWMGRVVGITLIALGAWILVELVRKGRDFRLRSRWMLMIDGTFAGLRRVRNAATRRFISVEHEHEHTHIDLRNAGEHDTAPAHDHGHTSALDEDVEDELVIDLTAAMPEPAAVGWRGVRERFSGAGGSAVATAGGRLRHGHSHSHTHRHDLALPDQATASYGNGTATGIGMLHGVGIESPTQIAIFVASTSVAGVGCGAVLLGAWVAGLIIANAVLALLAGAGLLNAERSFPIYATLAVIVSVASIALGTLYLLGLDILPGILT